MTVVSGLTPAQPLLPSTTAGAVRAARSDEARRTLARQQEAAGRGIRIAVFALGLIAFLLIHIVFGHDDFDVTTRVWAAVAGIVALTAGLTARRRTLTFGAYATGLLYASFGLSTFNEGDFHGALGPIPLRQESFALAAFAVVLVSLAMLVGIPLGRWVGRRCAPVIDAVSPDEVGAGFQVAAYVTAGFVVLVNSVQTLRPGLLPPALSFPAVIVSRPVLAQGILLVASLRSGDPRPRLVAVASTALLSLIGLSSGSLTPAVTPWVSLALLTWVVEGVIPWRGVIVAIGLIIVINPAKAAFRNDVWYARGGQTITLLDRIDIWQTVIARTWSGDAAETSRNMEVTADRISFLAYAAQSVEWVPSPVPESGFGRWAVIPTAFIPRFLWANKPDLTVENNVAYTRTFALQTDDSSRQTTIAFPIIADGFWAARLPGVALAGLLLGLFYGFVEGALRRDRWSTMVVGVAILASITPTTHLGSSLTGFPQTLVGSLAVMWMAAIGSRVLGGHTRIGRPRVTPTANP